MFHVYRFINEDNKIIYVGRTVNIASRISTHFGKSGHLPPECYESVKRIDCLAVKTRNDMKIKELYYISKYKPKYNTSDMHDVSFDFNELEDAWVVYESNAKTTSQLSDKLESKIESLKKRNQKLQKTIANLTSDRKNALPISVPQTQVFHEPISYDEYFIRQVHKYESIDNENIFKRIVVSLLGKEKIESYYSDVLKKDCTW